MASAEVISPQKQELVGGKLWNKALSYSLVNNLASRAQDFYGKAKESNSYLKSALEKGEGLAVKTINVTQPILSTVDKRLHIEERSIGLIDSIERHSLNTAQKLSDIQTKVVSTVTTTVARLSEPLVDRVEKYLVIVEELDDAPSLDDDADIKPAPKLDADPAEKVEPAVKLTRVTKKLGRVAVNKLNRVKNQTRDRIMKYQVAADILQFAQTHADVKSALAVRDAVTGRVHAATDFVKDTATSTAARLEASPLKPIFDRVLKPHLDTLKNQSSRAFLVALAAVGSVTDYIHAELRATWKGDWESTIDAAAVRARDIVTSYTGQSPQLLYVLEKVSQLGSTLQTEFTRYAAGTWSYLSTMRAVVQVQSALSQILLKAGIDPAKLTSVLFPAQPKKKLQ